MTLYYIRKANLCNLFRVEKILYRCGKDMAQKYGLKHWDNSHIKNILILVLCVMKNRIYLVTDEQRRVVATFQTKRAGDTLYFLKLATDPAFSGKGIGTFCIQTIEKMSVNAGCSKVCCEVYDQSIHAIRFYENRGYTVCGSDKTLKYTQLRMERQLRS